MTAPRAQVNPGQPLQIHAATWNALLAMLAKFQAGQLGAGRPMPVGGPPGLDVRVLNNSQYDVDRGGVLGIDGVEIDRATNADEFETRPTLTGVTPGTAHATKFLVTTEPIAYGSIGRAVLTGLAAVKLYVNDAGHGYAAAKDEEDGELETVATGGGAKILWKETGTGTGKWALVLLGGGGGGVGTDELVAVYGGTADYLDNVLVAGNGVTLDVDVNTLVLAAEAEDPDTNIDTLGPVDESGDPIEGTEPERDDTWTANGTKGLALWQTVRVVYYELGDEKLYEYRRKLTFDRWGRLYSVSGEKQIEIEAPEPCS